MTMHEIRFGKSLRELLLSCETRCVYACCGLEAAEFTSGQVMKWMSGKRLEHRAAVVCELDGLIRELSSMAEEEAVANELNTWWTKDKAVAFFAGLKNEIVKAIGPAGMERRVYELDGGRIRSLEDFYVQIGEVINGPGGYFGSNLDALEDCLGGGFGTPEGPYVIKWTRSKESKEALGHPEMVRHLEAILKSCHPSTRKDVQAKLAMAKSGIGPTVFEMLVQIVGSPVNVELRLE